MSFIKPTNTLPQVYLNIINETFNILKGSTEPLNSLSTMCKQKYAMTICRVCGEEIAWHIYVEKCADGVGLDNYHLCKNGVRIVPDKIDSECDECKEKRKKKEEEAKVLIK
jgi:hypothetical protein